jgi:hypothetical protein
LEDEIYTHYCENYGGIYSRFEGRLTEGDVEFIKKCFIPRATYTQLHNKYMLLKEKFQDLEKEVKQWKTIN